MCKIAKFKVRRLAHIVRVKHKIRGLEMRRIQKIMNDWTFVYHDGSRTVLDL